ncbi:MAG TPA: hypothetical protein VE913_08415 [Longimicrobium sp.]|nr:hypothetical protein [Longimicrobium sp.]
MMEYSTQVKVVDEATGRPLPGLAVALFDKDQFSRDDRLGSGATDAAGEVTFAYDDKHFSDVEDRISGSLPDLYCVVHAPDGSEAFSTRAETLDNTPRRQIVVAVPAEVVARHGWCG